MARTTTYTDPQAVSDALGRIVPEVERKLALAADENAAGIASAAQAAARSVGGPAALVLVTSMGPTINVTDLRGGAVWAGAEFGGGSRPRTRQFLPYLGTIGGGYYLWPTIRDRSQADLERSSEAVGDALDAI